MLHRSKLILEELAYGRFGELTSKLCPIIREGAEDTSKNFIKLLQYALVCKGYYMGPVIGKFEAGTSAAINKLKSDAFGVTITDSTVDPMWMKAILNSDAYHMKWISDGDVKIRAIQQYLNRNYHPYCGIMPCDGRYFRDTNRALICALQAEERHSS